MRLKNALRSQNYPFLSQYFSDGPSENASFPNEVQFEISILGVNEEHVLPNHINSIKTDNIRHILYEQPLRIKLDQKLRELMELLIVRMLREPNASINKLCSVHVALYQSQAELQ